MKHSSFSCSWKRHKSPFGPWQERSSSHLICILSYWARKNDGKKSDCIRRKNKHVKQKSSDFCPQKWQLLHSHWILGFHHQQPTIWIGMAYTTLLHVRHQKTRPLINRVRKFHIDQLWSHVCIYAIFSVVKFY